MKITISSTGPNIGVTAEARFGKRSYFLMVDPATVEFDPLPKPNIEEGGGAGIRKE